MIRKCKNCGHNKFFVDTLGIEHCSNCFEPTMIFTKATGTLSYEQIKLEEEIEENIRNKKI